VEKYIFIYIRGHFSRMVHFRMCTRERGRSDYESPQWGGGSKMGHFFRWQWIL